MNRLKMRNSPHVPFRTCAGAFFILIACASGMAAPSPGHPQLLSPQSDPIAIHEQHVFVVNTPADKLDVIETGSDRVIASIPTGIDPVSVAVRPDGREVWVSNHISDSVSVIDNDPESPTYLAVIATIQDLDLESRTTRFDEPVGIAFASNDKAYVALSSHSRIAIADVRSRKVTGSLTIPAQEPRSIVVKNGLLHVIPFESNNQTQLSGGKAGEIDGDLVTFEARKLADAFDTVGFTVDLIRRPEIPDPDLFVFDVTSDQLVRKVQTLGTLLYGLAVDHEGTAYIAHTEARNHVNGRAGTKGHGLKELDNRPYLNRIARVPARGEPGMIHLNPLPPEQPGRRRAIATPYAIKVSDDGETLFVTAAGSNHLVSLDAATGETLDRVKVGAVPRGIALETDLNGTPRTAWVLNAVENSVSKVNVSDRGMLEMVNTIQLSDPTPSRYKQGRVAFNTSRASSNGTFACASCHPDGHTDQLLWVLDTPHIYGAEQIEPRLSQTLRGLRDTAPYHWDGVPGDPYGGQNATTREQLPPNSDINKPESAVRHVIDGSMASTMMDEASDWTNDEGKRGYLSADERDALATFLLDLPHMPTRSRAFDDQVSEQARLGFERFHITGARDFKNLNVNVCGSCHTFPYLTTDQSSMNVPSFRGALDRYITQAQGRNSVVSLGGVQRIAENGWPEEEVWKRMLSMGDRGRLWPVIEMFKESSSGFSGAFGRQVTLSRSTMDAPETKTVVDALENRARNRDIVLELNGVFHDTDNPRVAHLRFDHATSADGYFEIGKSDLISKSDLWSSARAGNFTGTFTARHPSDVTSVPPAIWTAGSLHQQRGAQLFPRVNSERRSMRISGRHIRDSAFLLVNGDRVAGEIEPVARDLIDVTFDELPPPGMNLLQIRNPDSFISNDFIFFHESREEAVARYQKEPAYLLTTILNSAIINDHEEEAWIVMDAGADINMPHEETHFDKERPPLILASQYGRVRIVNELLKRGADPNIQDKNGNTALHRAAQMCRLEIVEKLIAAGAEKSTRNERGEVPNDLVNHFVRRGNFEKYHAPHHANLTLDFERYTTERPKVMTLLR